MSSKLKFLVIVILCWSMAIPTISGYRHTPTLNVEITDGGSILALNITGSEYDKSVDQKKHKVRVGDGLVSDIWSEVTQYEATTFGTNGFISALYGSTDVFFLVTHDFDMDWISFQWDVTHLYTPEEMAEREMEEGDDMWVFGTTEEVSVLGDAVGHGTESVFLTEDLQEDLEWDRVMINDTDGETPLYIAWEIKRSLNTHDIAGNDVVFDTTNTTSLRIASSGSHKQDNNVFEFVLSDLRIGGDVPIPTEPVTQTDIDETGFLIREFSFGLIYGVVMWLFVFVPSTIIVKKQNDKQKVEMNK